VWDSTTLQPVILLNDHATQLTALALNGAGDLLACADSDDAIHLWDFASRKVCHVLRGHQDQISCLAFSPDGRYLASAGADRVINLWDLRPEHLCTTQEGAARMRDLGGFRRSWTNLAISPDGMHLASSGGGSVLQLWDIPTGEGILLAPGDGVVHTLAYSPLGNCIAGGGADGRIRLWNTKTAELERIIQDEDQTDPITSLVFSPDGNRLASAGSSGTEVWLWDVASGQPVLLIPNALDSCAVEALAFHPKGQLLAAGGIDWLATGGSDGAITLWDLERKCDVSQFDGGSTGMAFHPSGRWLASASLVNSICVWDVETRQLVRELTGHEETVTCLAYSANGQWLASSSDDHTVRIWDAQSGRLLAVTELDTQAKVLLFSPDSQDLFTANGNTTSYQLDVQRLLSEGVPVSV